MAQRNQIFVPKKRFASSVLNHNSFHAANPLRWIVKQFSKPIRIKNISFQGFQVSAADEIQAATTCIES